MSRQLVVRTGLVSTQRLLLPSRTPLLPVTTIRHLAKGKKKEKEKKSKGKAASRSDGEEGGGDDGSDADASVFDLESLKEQLAKASEQLQKSYTGLQTGRASPALLDGVMVDAGGGEVPLSSIAKVLAQGPQTLTVSCYESNAIAPAAKAIERLPLGLRAETQGKVLRVAVPRPTQESRQALAKQARTLAETAKGRMRDARQRAMKRAKAEPSKEEVKRAEKAVEDATKAAVAEVDSAMKAKEKEVLTV